MDLACQVPYDSIHHRRTDTITKLLDSLASRSIKQKVVPILESHGAHQFRNPKHPKVPTISAPILWPQAGQTIRSSVSKEGVGLICHRHFVGPAPGECSERGPGNLGAFFGCQAGTVEYDLGDPAIKEVVPLRAIPSGDLESSHRAMSDLERIRDHVQLSDNTSECDGKTQGRFPLRVATQSEAAHAGCL